MGNRPWYEFQLQIGPSSDHTKTHSDSCDEMEDWSCITSLGMGNLAPPLEAALGEKLKDNYRLLGLEGLHWA